MDDERSITRANITQQQQQQQHQCQYAQGSSSNFPPLVREGQHYDPVHESREWYQRRSITPNQPSHIAQISSTSWTLPSFAPFQNQSYQVYQEVLRSSNQSQDLNTDRPTRMSYDSFGNDSQSFNTPHPSNTHNNGLSNTPTRFPISTSLTDSDPIDFDFMSPVYHNNHHPSSPLSSASRVPANVTMGADRNLNFNYPIHSRYELRGTVSTRSERIRQESNTDFPSEPGTSFQLELPHHRRRSQNHLVDAEGGNLSYTNAYMTVQRRQDENAYSSDDVRSIAAMRGAVALGKKVPSREAIASLETLKLEELKGNDRSCIICYNEFGVKNPEGIIEIPLRLPRCKHVFGDKCIKKWFEDSDSCPYCRDKLPSELSLKKTNGFEAFRAARDRIYALSQRSRQESLTMRHLSTVELTNARSTNIIEALGQSATSEFGSLVSRDTSWGNIPLGRSSTTDSSERRRHTRSRVGNIRAITQMARPTSVGSTRTINLNPPTPSYPRTSSQIPVPFSGNLSDFASDISGSIGTSGLMGGQITISHTPPNTSQSLGLGVSRSSSPETTHLQHFERNDMEVTGLSHLERLNEVRNEMRRSLEDVSNSFQSGFNNHPILRIGQQDFSNYPQNLQFIQNQTQISPLGYSSHRQREDFLRAQESGAPSQNIPNSRSQDTRPGDFVSLLS